MKAYLADLQERLDEALSEVDSLRDERDGLRESLVDAQKEIERLRADKERLDWVESQSNGSMVWLARQSTTGRGFRLHNEHPQHSPMPFAYTARQAIDAARQLPSPT